MTLTLFSVVVSDAPPVVDCLLLADGSPLLLADGGYILL